MQFRILFAASALAVGTLAGANLTSGMQAGKTGLKSVGPLAFGPDGILFAGDPIGAQILAFDTGDAKAAEGGDVDLPGLQEKIAAQLGTAADQILVNDMAVNPISKAVYLSVQRGRGPDATPVILRLRGGKLEDLKLDTLPHASATLLHVPADAKDQRGSAARRLPTWPTRMAKSSWLACPMRSSRPPCGLSISPLPRRPASPTSRFSTARTVATRPTRPSVPSPRITSAPNLTCWRPTRAPRW